MKIALTISYVLIVILAVFVYMNYKEIKRLEALIPTAPKPNTNPASNSAQTPGTDRTSVSGGTLWDELQNSISDMTVDLKFNKPNA